MSGENLVLLRAEYFKLDRQFAEGNTKRSEIKKIERKLNKVREKIMKLTNV